MLRAITLVLSISLFSHSFANERGNPTCPQVLDLMYRGFTIDNLDHSYDRLMNKFLLAIYYANLNKNNSTQNQSNVTNALNQARSLDASLDQYISPEDNYYRSFFSRFFGGFLGSRSHSVPASRTSTQSLQQTLSNWMDLQSNNPEIFQGMSEEFKFDEWELSSYNLQDSEFENRLEQLASQLNSSRADLLQGRQFNDTALKSLIEQTSSELVSGMNNSYADRLHNYQSVCSEEDLSLYIQSENAICPVLSENTSFNDINDQLNQLALLINRTDLMSTPEVDTPEPIYQVEYETNDSNGATHCLRDTDMITTIVLHHTGTRSSLTPIEINNSHLQQSSEVSGNPPVSEPWYMISYNYLISETFQGATEAEPRVFQGRPPEMKGAHAGAYSARISNAQRRSLSRRTIQCGNNTDGFQTIPALHTSQMSRGNYLSGNLDSLGIAVIGNFDDVVIRYIDGIPIPSAVNRDNIVSHPSDQVLEKVAKLSCDLQKRYPSITRIVPHRYFKETECPAALLLYFDRIKQRTQELGCNFDFILTKRQDMERR